MNEIERKEYARAVAQRIEEEFVARLERFMGMAIPAVHPRLVAAEPEQEPVRCPFLRLAA